MSGQARWQRYRTTPAPILGRVRPFVVNTRAELMLAAKPIQLPRPGKLGIARYGFSTTNPR